MRLVGGKKGRIKTANVVFQKNKEKEEGRDKWRNRVVGNIPKLE